MPWVDRAIEAYLFFWAGLVLRARRPLIVGITGSVGKTTTMETIAAALTHPEVRALVGRVWKTQGALNNTQGVPLTVLGHREWPSRVRMAGWLCAMPLRALGLAWVVRYPGILVLEYAAGPRGDIERTAALACPTVAVVTAIGPAHLEHFGTIERLVRAKGALVRRVPPGGLVVLGSDNALAAGLACDVRAPVVMVPGRGRALAAGAALAVCDYLRVPSAAAERAVAAVPVVPGRLQFVECGGITVIDDSYNANPLSMRLGLDTLAERGGAGRRRVAILGDMNELGVESPRFHAEVGACARSCADLVIGVGALARIYEPARWFATSAECAAALPGLLAPGDCVLVKGSHAVGLERVVQALRAAGTWR